MTTCNVTNYIRDIYFYKIRHIIRDVISQKYTNEELRLFIIYI